MCSEVSDVNIMHVRLIRKHLPPVWSWFSRVAVGIVVIELFLLCGIAHA